MTLFRTSRPGPTAWIAAKTLTQIAVVWTAALWALPEALQRVEDQVDVPPLPGRRTAAAGRSLFLAASALGIVAAAEMAVVGRGTPVPFDAAPVLVIRGPYRVVRNPMAVSGVLQLAGVALRRRSPTMLLAAAGGAILWQLGMRPSEERFLSARFGAEYEAYRRAVPCWRPVRPYRPRGTGT